MNEVNPYLNKMIDKWTWTVVDYRLYFFRKFLSRLSVKSAGQFWTVNDNMDGT